MLCTVYSVNLETKRRSQEDCILKHTEMSLWLKSNGDTNTVYEVLKDSELHSRWCWREDGVNWCLIMCNLNNNRYIVKC